MDPLLKLYKGCQLMLVFNNNVRHGEAKGTTVTLISVCLKPNIIPIQIIISKLPVKAVYASQVISIILKHNNRLYLCNKLSMDLTKYAMLWELQKMIQQLENRAPTFWTQEQYEDLFNHG